MVSTPEIFTDNSPMLSIPSVYVKQPNTSKSIHPFSETLVIKKNTYVRRLCATKSKRKKIRAVSMSWSIRPK